MFNFSLSRILSINNKEWTKIRRDPFTLAILIAIPLFQIIIFGYGINIYSKHLRTAIVAYDQSPFTRKFIQALTSSEYFDIKYTLADETNAKQLMKNNDVSFIITIPVDFTKDLIRNNRPHILVEVDASTANVLGNAFSVIQGIAQSVFTREFKSLNYINNDPAIILDLHANYNENLVSIYSIAPGLTNVILTILLTFLTSLTISEEKESGTLETLFKSPINPYEIIIGKLLCYFVISYVVLILMLILILVLFHLPFYSGFFDYIVAALPFILCNLLYGIAVSSLSKNQIEAQQYIGLYLIFSFLFSGFMFPFDGMPNWAKTVGSLLPMTHFIRISAGIILKGYTWSNIWRQEIPILIFMFMLILLIGIFFRRRVS